MLAFLPLCRVGCCCSCCCCIFCSISRRLQIGFVYGIGIGIGMVLIVERRDLRVNFLALLNFRLFRGLELQPNAYQSDFDLAATIRCLCYFGCSILFCVFLEAETCIGCCLFASVTIRRSCRYARLAIEPIAEPGTDGKLFRERHLHSLQIGECAVRFSCIHGM